MSERMSDFRSQRAGFDEKLRELRYELSVAREKDGGQMSDRRYGKDE